MTYLGQTGEHSGRFERHGRQQWWYGICLLYSGIRTRHPDVTESSMRSSFISETIPNISHFCNPKFFDKTTSGLCVLVKLHENYARGSS